MFKCPSLEMDGLAEIHKPLQKTDWLVPLHWHSNFAELFAYACFEKGPQVDVASVGLWHWQLGARSR